MDFCSMQPRVKLLPCRPEVAHLQVLTVCHTDATVTFVLIFLFDTAVVVFVIPQASHGIGNF